MTLHTYPNVEQGSGEWHDLRRGLVTASTVGQLITLRRLTAIDCDCPNCEAPANDPCRSKRNGGTLKTLHTERAAVAKSTASPLVFDVASNDVSRSLTLLLVAERITGWTEDTYTSDDMWRGISDEPRARDKYTEHYTPVTECGFMVRDDWGFRIGFSPDGLVGMDGLIEVKSRRPKSQVATVIAGHPPIEVMPQLQCGLLVSGRKWIDYISFAGGMPMYVKRVYPDRRWFDAIVSAVRSFEANAAEMLRLYQERVIGFPPTERVIEQEIEV